MRHAAALSVGLAMIAALAACAGPSTEPQVDEPLAQTAAKAVEAPNAAEAKKPQEAQKAEEAKKPQEAHAAACPEGMALVPEGVYRMQKTRKKTTNVQAFCMDTTEVTVDAYRSCVHEGKCSPYCLSVNKTKGKDGKVEDPTSCMAVPNQADWGDTDESFVASRFCNGDNDDKRDHPVNCVSYDEARTFCAARGKRLPRPAEWEWAARRADPKMWWPWGNEQPEDQLCWSPKGKKHYGTCAVGSKPKDVTPQGIKDMGGNVSEWVDAGDPRAHGGAKSFYTIFGASWYATDDGYVSGTLGGVETPSPRSETVGFRCAKDVAR